MTEEERPVGEDYCMNLPIWKLPNHEWMTTCYNSKMRTITMTKFHKGQSGDLTYKKFTLHVPALIEAYRVMEDYDKNNN